MAQLQLLNRQAIEDLRRDHQRLQFQIANLTTRLRAFTALGDDDEGKKAFCYFSVTEAFTTSDSSVTGTIQEQFGPGTEHTTTTDVEFLNAREHTAATYIFEGDNGDWGIAAWSGDLSTNDWHIIQFECP